MEMLAWWKMIGMIGNMLKIIGMCGNVLENIWFKKGNNLDLEMDEIYEMGIYWGKGNYNEHALAKIDCPGPTR